MEFFHKKTNIDFLGIKRWTGLLSIILVIASIVCVSIKGLNWGLEFTGGFEIQAHYQTSPDLDKIRGELTKAGIHHSDVITFGSTKDVMLRFAPQADMQTQSIHGQHSSVQDQLKAEIQTVLGPAAHIEQVTYIGAEVGAELAQKGILAMIIAVIATMIYIGLRFELRFAFSSAVALAHDPIIILGIFFHDLIFRKIHDVNLSCCR